MVTMVVNWTLVFAVTVIGLAKTPAAGKMVTSTRVTIKKKVLLNVSSVLIVPKPIFALTIVVHVLYLCRVPTTVSITVRHNAAKLTALH